MESKVSVIIPVYNRQNVVAECVESVLAQTYENFEIILIDDGSADRTVAVCRELAKRDERIRILEAQHGGVSAARNAGIEAATGEYIFFVDSDDVIHPCLMATLLNGMKTSDAQMAATERKDILQRNWEMVQTLLAEDGAVQTTYKSNAQALYAMFCTRCPLRVMGGNMMHRELIGATRFRTELSIGEDFAFIYDNLVKGANVIFLEHPWYYGRIHSENTSWNYTYAGFWSRFYRRKVVWESEETYGRTEYADKQKRDAVSIFFHCVEHAEADRADRKKMRAVAREHGAVLLPALSRSEKILFQLCIYTPAVYSLLKKAKKVLGKRR